MKNYCSSIARYLAILSLTTLLLIPTSTASGACRVSRGGSSFGGFFRALFGGRTRTGRFVSQTPIIATEALPIPIQDGDPSGPPAPPAVKSSKPEDTHPVLEVPQQIFSLTEATSPKFTLTTPPFNLLKTTTVRGPAVKAYEEETPFQLIGKPKKVKALQEKTTPTPPKPKIKFALANEGPPPEPEDPQYAPPALEVGGADSAIPLGELVQLWVKAPDRIPDNLISTAYTWTVLPTKNFVVWPDKTRILFGAGVSNTRFSVIITAAHVFADKDEDGKFSKVVQRAVTKMVEVKIGDGTVIPPPGGGGGNGGGGGGLTGIAKQANDWAVHVSVSNTYTDAMKKSDATKLAGSFAKIAAQIQNGTLKDITSILKATKTSNDQTITAHAQWLPWFTRMSEFLQKSYNEGSIKTVAQFGTAWVEISKGLTAAAK